MIPNIAVFDHAKNITVGAARVIWAPLQLRPGREPLLAGWVLPGGERTQNEAVATRAAQDLNAFICAASGHKFPLHAPKEPT